MQVNGERCGHRRKRLVMVDHDMKANIVIAPRIIACLGAEAPPAIVVNCRLDGSVLR